MHELNLQLATYVRRERKRQKLTGAKIDELTGGAISTVTLSKLENGKTRWSLDHIAALASALGTTPDGLLSSATGVVRDNPGVPTDLLPLLNAAASAQWGDVVIALGALVSESRRSV